MKVKIRLSRTERLFALLILVAISYAASAVKPVTPAKPVELLEIATSSASASAASPSAAMEEAVVSRVVDGDTIKLADGRTLRYIGIDTPETVHPTKGLECYGEEAKKENRRLIEGKTVRMEKDISETDRYGRLLRYVYIGDDMINGMLVRGGFAHAATFPPDVKYAELFVAAEQEAERYGIGLWSGCPSDHQ